MDCREMSAYLSDYLDGELDASIRQLIDRHGGQCPPCRAFIRTLSRTVEAVRAQPREPLCATLRQSLVDSLRKASLKSN
jgi:predicted anti-sigma-YlaC factor YlaD